MAAYPVSGKFFLEPTSAGVGGTSLTAVQERIYVMTVIEKLVTMRSGLGTDPQIRTYRERSGAATLSLNPHNQADAETIKLLFAQLTTAGTEIRVEGGTSAIQFTKLPTFAGVVRPNDPSESHIYSPAWSLHPDTVQGWTQNDLLTVLDSDELVLVAGKATNGTGPSYMVGSAGAIDTAYGLEA